MSDSDHSALGIVGPEGAPQHLDARSIVQRSAAAAIATEADDRILYVNQPALALLGYTAKQIVGRKFSRVFRPRDVYGNRFHYDYSLIFELLERGDPLRSFEYDVLKATGAYQRAAVSVVVVVGAHRRSYELVHILWPREGRRKVDEVIAHMLTGSSRLDVGAIEATLARRHEDEDLTRRQREILGLLANGKSSRQVAELLHLSPETVRNHIRNILSRLGVHSRVEAVSIAHRRHLI